MHPLTWHPAFHLCNRCFRLLPGSQVSGRTSSEALNNRDSGVRHTNCVFFGAQKIRENRVHHEQVYFFFNTSSLGPFQLRLPFLHMGNAQPSGAAQAAASANLNIALDKSVEEPEHQTERLLMAARKSVRIAY